MLLTDAILSKLKLEPWCTLCVPYTSIIPYPLSSPINRANLLILRPESEKKIVQSVMFLRSHINPAYESTFPPSLCTRPCAFSWTANAAYGRGSANTEGRNTHKLLSPAASTFARRLAAVDPAPEKYREKTGWMNERKTTLAPLNEL